MLGGFLSALMTWLLLLGRLHTTAAAAIAAAAVAAWFLFTRGGHGHGAGFLSIDARAQRSRLGGISAGVKLASSAAFVIICVSFTSRILPLVLFAAMALLTCAVGGTPAGYYLRLLKIPALFILAGALAIVVQVSGGPTGALSIGRGSLWLSVTAVSQAQGLTLILKAVGSVSCLYMLSLSTPMGQIIDALRRARIPSVVAELMYLIYRYIFVLLETQADMQDAAASRLGYNGVKTSLKTALACSTNLLFVSFRRSADCFSAMESRCYDGEIRFLDTSPRTRPREIVVAAASCALLILVGILTGGLII